MLMYTYKDLEDNKSKLWAGDCILVSRSPSIKALSAMVIQMATRGPWNHAGLLDVQPDGLKIYEADTRKGNCVSLLSRYNSDEYKFMVLRPIHLKDGATRYTKNTGTKVLIEAMSKLGLKYDFTALAGFAIEVLFKGVPSFLFKKFINPVQLKNRFFCSEYVINAYRAANVSVCDGMNQSSISPNDLFRDLSNGMKLVDLTGERNSELAMLYEVNRNELLIRMTDEGKSC